jgi:hypothetical protein
LGYIHCDDKSSGAAVNRLLNPTVKGVPLEGDSISIKLPYKVRQLSGEYPLMEFAPGDHFKAEIGCLDPDTHCTVIFEVMLYYSDKQNFVIGRWSLTNDPGFEQIDLDLSKFAGQKVWLALDTSNDNSLVDQNPIWFMPRIEN